MKNYFIIFLTLVSTSVSLRAQDNSAASFCYSGQNGRWLQLDEVLAGTGYKGASERVELEISGGEYNTFGQITYLIEARDALQLSAYQVNGTVADHELVILDNGAASSADDKYVIGIRLPDADWKSVCLRARELTSKTWLTFTPTTEPSLTNVTPTTTWLYKSQSNGDFTVDNNMGVGTTTPDAKFHVEDGGGFARTALSGEGGWFVKRNTTSESESLFFVRNGNGDYALTAKGDGKIGVGTSSPTAKFHIEDGGGYARMANSGLGGWFVKRNATSGNNSIMNLLNGNDEFVLSAKADGKVGIGTSNPKNTLSVHGTIWAKKIHV